MESKLFLLVAFVLLFGDITASKEPAHHHKDHLGNTEHDVNFDRKVLLQDAEERMEEALSKLTSSEQKERLKKLVEKKIDLNHDGFVSWKELEEWTLKAFNEFETEETREEFPLLDVDDDGNVTWEEFVSFTYGSDFNEDFEEFKRPDSEAWKSFVESYKHNKKMFEAADQQEPMKSLDKFEYIAFKHPRFTRKTRDVFIDDVLQKSDLNQDGGIDLKEFLAHYQKNSDGEDPDWTIVETDKFKEELDVNHDNLLTGNEIMNWMASDNIEEAREEADHLISECDTNGDSKLTINEILSNKELWMESDATDYGKRLVRIHDEF
ncbi:reticulocalbin-2-like [Clavelina lepadiformis]|uniref:reticulocalbin-2-like n=1 Tax=Clavelina lepadiformis TaxID=159417 RepID=UPI004041D259